jgi:Tfp pilus assembly protein PilN
MAANLQEPPQHLLFLSAKPQTAGLGQALAAAMNLNLLESPIGHDTSGLFSECPAASLPAAASAWASLTKIHDFNLLQSISGFDGQKNLFRPHLRFASIALAAVILCWGLAFGVDIFLQKSRLTALNTEIINTFQGIAPDAADNVQPVQYTSVIKSRIQALQSGDEGAKIPDISVSEVMEAISNALPKNLDLQVTLLALDGSDLRMNALAQDFKTVDAVKNAFENTEFVQTVSIAGANVDQGGAGVSFSLRLQLARK